MIKFYKLANDIVLSTLSIIFWLENKKSINNFFNLPIGMVIGK